MLYRCLPLLTAIIVTFTPFLLLAQQQQQLQSVTKPNIVILLADDLGWGDVGYHNSDVVTPN
ncbi:MAG: arylsulfatase, partial [Pseudomonadota bacterium]|nr:arylsulfatase [Pseudomonadota bacterium]